MSYRRYSRYNFSYKGRMALKKERCTYSSEYAKSLLKGLKCESVDGNGKPVRSRSKAKEFYLEKFFDL